MGMSGSKSTAPEITNEAANGIIFSTLAAVLVLTAIFMLAMRDTKVGFDKDSYIAARNSQGVVSLTLSYFVSGMGAWVIFAVPQAACIGGWVGLLGYSLSTAAPLLIFGWIAPIMRRNLPRGFTLNEYVHARFGKLCAAYFGLVSLFYMMLYLTAELASAGTISTSLTKIKVQSDTWWKNDNVFLPMPISPIVGMSLITLLYTVIGGLPVSILTDRVQGVGVFILVLIIVIAAYGEAGKGNSDFWDDVTGHGVHPKYVPTDYGNSIAIAISLFLGVTTANLVHAGYWQRIWAAESNAAVERATIYSSIMSVLVMVLVGITGWIAYSHFITVDPVTNVSSSFMLVVPAPPMFDLSFLSVPWLINYFMGKSWAVVALIFVISMIASTCDSLQSGMTALLSPAIDYALPSMSENVRLVIVVLLMALLNVPPMLVALSGQSILQLFLLADLLAATVVAPLFLGFRTDVHPYGALAGAVTGLVTVFVVYGIGEHFDEGFDVLVEQGGIFRRVATYAFTLTPVFSGAVTMAVSKLGFPGYKFEGYPDKGSAGKEQVQVTMTQATMSAA